MPASKRPNPDALPAEEQPRPGPLPTDGDTVREVGKRGYEDARGPKKDTDQAGFESQRKRAPPNSPARRSDKADGSDNR